MKFGHLTVEKNRNSRKRTTLETLFHKSEYANEYMNIPESDMQIELKKLRKLITILQTKRLRENAKSKCKYFKL